jgi:hypothetical protein
MQGELSKVVASWVRDMLAPLRSSWAQRSLRAQGACVRTKQSLMPLSDSTHHTGHALPWTGIEQDGGENKTGPPLFPAHAEGSSRLSSTREAAITAMPVNAPIEVKRLLGSNDSALRQDVCVRVHVSAR